MPDLTAFAYWLIPIGLWRAKWPVECAIAWETSLISGPGLPTLGEITQLPVFVSSVS
jgi:hypothetical protein